MSLGGLIAGALGGAAKGYTQFAESELKKNQELDLRKQLMEAETEKQLRIDEIKRSRDITDIGRRAQADADAAPIVARGRVAGEIATIDAATEAGLPEKKAGYEKTTYAAGRDLAVTKAKDAGTDAATTAVSKVGTEGYTDAVSKESVAKAAGDIAEIKERNKGDMARDAAKPPKAGAGGGNDTSLDLERRFKAASRNLAQQLGVAETKVNEELSFLKRKAESGDAKAIKRWENVQGALKDWQDANTALRNFTRKQQTAPAPAAGSGERPPLSSFGG